MHFLASEFSGAELRLEAVPSFPQTPTHERLLPSSGGPVAPNEDMRVLRSPCPASTAWQISHRATPSTQVAFWEHG